jgi:hypothetical protein
MSTTGSIFPAPFFTAFNNSGIMVPGALVNFYVTGTSTRAAVWADAGLITPLSNPAQCDSAGRLVAYLDPSVGAYKVVFTDASGATLKTVDPVTATNTGLSGLGEITVFGGLAASPVTVTTYPSGATYDKLHPGTGVYFIDSATLTPGTYVIEATGTTSVGNTITLAIVNLDDGAPDTPLATLTISSATGARGRSLSIAFAAGGTAKTYGIKSKMDAGTGFAWNVRLLRTA